VEEDRAAFIEAKALKEDVRRRTERRRLDELVDHQSTRARHKRKQHQCYQQMRLAARHWEEEE